MARLVREKAKNFLLKKLGAKVTKSHYVRCDWCGKETKAYYDSEEGVRAPRGWTGLNGQIAYGTPLKRRSRHLDFCSKSCLNNYKDIVSAADRAALDAWKLTYRAARDKYLADRKSKPLAMQNMPIKVEAPAPIPTKVEKIPDSELDVDREAIERFKRLEL